MTERRGTADQRAALAAAAIGVVERAGTSVVTLDEIAAAARVDAGVASALFDSVDELLIEAALRLATADLGLDGSGAPTVSTFSHHFARRRAFYRAMRVGSIAPRLDARMSAVMGPLIATQIRTLVGGRISDGLLEQLTVDVTLECFEVTNRWILEARDDDGPESLYVRFEAIVLRRLEEVRAAR
ncbi:hypothetical protein GCM10027413_11000 [Conyzicola nivalis]|uniref:Uncharacterized protein n=1 Tax=Conyzicola nivalis TaxID=1477021 RepID=A0A916SI36_9MICO|nr:hypothetical protein [Conyzicola nivalis]GGB01886.1 hypothetical protein GCM10010979_15630 [Conyzicola nivalis]